MDIRKLPVLLKVEEMAEILNVENNSIYKLIVINRLPVVVCYNQTIRVPKKDFIKFLIRKEVMVS
ncbi:helix-turn-helix domain-containing protein [Clostridium sp. DL1XJH146]